MNITDKKIMNKQLNVKCHAGNCGKVNLHFFHCKLYNDFQKR